MRLKTPGFGTLHIFTNLPNFSDIHGVMGKGAAFDQITQVPAVQGLVHDCQQPGFHLWLVAVTYGFQQQFTQGAILKGQLAQYIKNLPAQRITLLGELFQQPEIDFAFPRILGNKVPEVAYLGLPDAVNAAKTLLKTVRVPRQVIINHQMRPLKINAFAGGVGRHQNFDLLILGE